MNRQHDLSELMSSPYQYAPAPTDDMGTPHKEFSTPPRRSQSIDRPETDKLSMIEKEKEEQNTLEEQTDLLLDIAMTTTFNSLLSGTPITDGQSLVSFLCIFVLVWWVWASHVIYNARFREYNWPNRVFLFLQLLVFCAFAAFTSGFNIENGIADDSADQRILDGLRLDQGWDNSTIIAQAAREDRIPVLNERGISMVMATSRLLVLVQYLYAFAKARVKSERIRHPFYVQLAPFVISAGCYIAAFVTLGDNPSRHSQIAKIILWFFPVVLEIITHLVVSFLVDSDPVPSDVDALAVKYNAKTFRARSATVFIIVLGGGLDSITSGFHFMIGNLSFGTHRVGIVLCSSIIFILLFTLHFTSIPDRDRLDVRGEGVKRRRDLGLFFFGFFYLSAVVITLQGIGSMLQVGNIGDSMQTAFQFLRESESALNSTDFHTPLDLGAYDMDTKHRITNNGYNMTLFVKTINSYIPPDPDFAHPYQIVLHLDMDILSDGLNTINAFQEEDLQSLVTNKINAFLSLPDTEMNKARFMDVVNTVITTNATPALWFLPFGGATLLFLGIMTLIDRWSSMKIYTWCQVASRFTAGILLVGLAALDEHASTITVDENYHYTGSRIWKLAAQNWVLPIYALVLLLEQVWEYILVYLARRRYELPGRI
ncbi:hypothetical protein BXZ70DRAFT_690236 [Cristinia sonorae]|uniref:Uncharacterized protein n=1 Tax=Cristinia sonorae TaxID=1940300 RepID=A0A8K0UDT2_9AGAR|nr:hypothetical protein BXZ70DRAFT_690236 [Cristinia sonorae]